MIIDLDSHLREGYFADQVYKLATPFEEYTPICIKEGEPHERRFKTKFERRQRRGEQQRLQPQLHVRSQGELEGREHCPAAGSGL
jgi:hypothetical protein